MGYVFIFGAVMYTVYGNLVLKWKVNEAGQPPEELFDKILFLAAIVPNPWILSCFAAGLGAFFCWMAALTKFELNYAYPFMSLSFILVGVSSAFIFGEALTKEKVIGLVLIVAGLIIGSRT